VQYGYLAANNITGGYDAATESAVRNFQSTHGLKVDGICGSQTLSVLFGY
jgi:peptidoglycan hydrolase-like protein with peptidoglycan-binding domain